MGSQKSWDKPKETSYHVWRRSIYYSWIQFKSKSSDRLPLLSKFGSSDPYYLSKKSNHKWTQPILWILIGGDYTKEEYDFSKAVKNPYASKLKKQITINIDVDTIDFFKRQASTTGIPYQTLINLYLSDCMKNNRQLHTSWQWYSKVLILKLFLNAGWTFVRFMV